MGLCMRWVRLGAHHNAAVFCTWRMCGRTSWGDIVLKKILYVDSAICMIAHRYIKSVPWCEEMRQTTTACQPVHS